MAYLTIRQQAEALASTFPQPTTAEHRLFWALVWIAARQRLDVLKDAKS